MVNTIKIAATLCRHRTRYSTSSGVNPLATGWGFGSASTIDTHIEVEGIRDEGILHQISAVSADWGQNTHTHTHLQVVTIVTTEPDCDRQHSFN